MKYYLKAFVDEAILFPSFGLDTFSNDALKHLKQLQFQKSLLNISEVSVTDNVSGNGPDKKFSLGLTNVTFSLTDPINFSKIKKNQICFCKTLNALQSCSNNKKEEL